MAAGDHAGRPHFAPTARHAPRGRVILVDAGAEFRGYASDRHPNIRGGGCRGREQALVHETVRRAARPRSPRAGRASSGNRFTARAALVVADGLVELGVLRWPPLGAVRKRCRDASFFTGWPHVGLGIRDAGAATDEDAGAPARTAAAGVDIALAPRQAWTVEPGVTSARAARRRSRARRIASGTALTSCEASAASASRQNVLIGKRRCEVLTAGHPLAPD